MTFDTRHYVPVLKAKRGEKAALREIDASRRSLITPLLEIVERNPANAPLLEKHLDTAFEKLAASVSGYGRCFLDVRELESEGPDAAREVFRRAQLEGIRFTPVTGISRTVDVSAALTHRSLGIALRLTRKEFETGNLSTDLISFLTAHRITPEEADLIIDIGAVDDMVQPGIESLSDAFLAEVPEHRRWRSFTLSGCAFPASMGGVAKNAHLAVDRNEWLDWRDHRHARRDAMTRLPTYSDCGIQHPKGVEGYDPRIMPASAAIRYTATNDSWLLIKGESTKITSTLVQFPVLARHLAYGPHQTTFAGPGHCAGCRAMKACADGAPKLGSPVVWRRLGTIHHITTVVDEITALPWP